MSMRITSLRALAFLMAILASLGARAQYHGGGGSGIPQPVVNGQCLIGSGGQAVWGSCSGAGTSVSSVTGTTGQIAVAPTSGATVVSLPATITSNQAFSGTVNMTGIFEVGGAALSLGGAISLPAPVANDLLVGSSGTAVGNLPTANNGVLVTSALGAPSISTTLPSGLTIPGFNALIAWPPSGALMLSNGGNAPTAYPGTSCTNQALTALAGSGAGTCNSITSAYISGAITASQMLALATGNVYQGDGASHAQSVSLSVAIDTAIGSAQGDIIYRSGTTWTVLAPGTSGQVLQTAGAGANPAWANITASAGGASGQLQYNNAGALAGLTIAGPMSSGLDLIGSAQGDLLYRGAAGWVVLPPGTSGQYLQTAGAAANPSWQPVTASLPSLASNTVWLGNGSNVATSTPPSGVLDVIGSAQGDVLYRSASGWSVLAPGTSGQFLQTAGPSANPVWSGVTATPGGSTGQIQYNNAGSLGGFTPAGDCTILVPNISCTKINGVAITLGGAFTTSSALSLPTPIVNDLLVGTSGTAVGNLATGNNGVLVTSGLGAPSISTTLPSGLTIPGFNALIAWPPSGALMLSNGGNAPTAYPGTSCTNQALTALSIAGAGTCSSITNAFLTAGNFSSITGVGTLTSGAWNASIIGPTYGGTGVNNGSATLTLGASLLTTGLGAPTLAFPATPATYTFPLGSATLLANDFSNIATARLPAANMVSLPQFNVYQGNASSNPAAVTFATAMAAPTASGGLGSTRGTIPEYGSAGWQPLGPGTSGQCFVSNGAGTDPSFQTCPGLTAANPTATAGPAAVNGVATTFMRSDAAPAVQLGTAAQAGLLQVGGGLSVAAGVVSLSTPVAVGSGGTGLTAGISGGILGFTGSGTLASSGLLAANQLVLGGGVGATPSTLGSLGTATTVLHGNASGAPTFGAVALGTDVSGNLPFANMVNVTGPTIIGRVTATSGAMSAAYTPSNGTDTTVALAHGAFVLNHCAQFADTGGSVSDSGSTCAGATTINLAPGLGNSQATFNGTGTAQSVSNGSTIYPQYSSVPKTAAYSLNADCSAGALALCDTVRMVLANGSGSIPITAPNPIGTLGSYQISDQSGHGFTVSTVGGTAIFAGCVNTSPTTLTVPAGYAVQLYDQGSVANSYYCVFAQLGSVTAVANGGTGQTSYVDGQLLIGDTNTGGLDKNTVTGSNGITVTNGHGTIAIAEPIYSQAFSIGWVAAVNPNNAIIVAALPAAFTITSIVGRPEVATGSTATASVNIAANATACSAGTTVHSGSFNANGTAATNQSLTLTTTAVPAGDSICLQTTGTTAWTSGAGIGTITVYGHY